MISLFIEKYYLFIYIIPNWVSWQSDATNMMGSMPDKLFSALCKLILSWLEMNYDEAHLWFNSVKQVSENPKS